MQLSAVAKTNHLASQICNEYPVSVSGFGTTKSDCLKVIAGKIMNDSDVQLCTEYPVSASGFGMTKFLCLQELANKESLSEGLMSASSDDISSDSVSMEDHVKHTQPQDSNPVRDTIDKAIKFCSHEVPSYHKEECLGVVAPAQFIDAKAFDLCKKQASHKLVRCLVAIVNKTYTPSLIEECAGRSSYNHVECLSKYGALIDTQKNSVVIVIGGNIYDGSHLPDCRHENFYGLYPEGGGCDFNGCWIAGGGCNFDGCWYPGGACSFDGCINEAPTEGICIER